MTTPLTLAELNERRRERAQIEDDLRRMRKRLTVLTREILSGVAAPAPGAIDGQLALPVDAASDRTDMEAAAEEAVAHNRAEDVRRALLDRLDEGPADAASLLESVSHRLMLAGRREANLFEVSERLAVLVSSGVAVVEAGTYRRAPKAPAAREHRAPLRSAVLSQLEAASRWRSARVLVALLGGSEREDDVRGVCEGLVAEGLAARKQGAYKLAEKVKKKGGKSKPTAAPPPPPAPARPDLSADVRPPACGWEEAISLTIRLLVEQGEEGTRAGEVEKATTRRSATEAPRVVLDAYCAARVLELLDSAGVAAREQDDIAFPYTPSIHLDGRNERARIASAHKLLADYLTGLVEDSDPQTSGELGRALEVPEGLVVAALERIPRGAVWRDADGRWHPKPKPSTRRVKAKGQGATVAAEGSAG
jgi:hypothetical protein